MKKLKKTKKKKNLKQILKIIKFKQKKNLTKNKIPKFKKEKLTLFHHKNSKKKSI